MNDQQLHIATTSEQVIAFDNDRTIRWVKQVTFPRVAELEDLVVIAGSGGLPGNKQLMACDIASGETGEQKETQKNFSDLVFFEGKIFGSFSEAEGNKWNRGVCHLSRRLDEVKYYAHEKNRSDNFGSGKFMIVDGSLYYKHRWTFSRLAGNDFQKVEWHPTDLFKDAKEPEDMPLIGGDRCFYLHDNGFRLYKISTKGEVADNFTVFGSFDRFSWLKLPSGFLHARGYDHTVLEFYENDFTWHGHVAYPKDFYMEQRRTQCFLGPNQEELLVNPPTSARPGRKIKVYEFDRKHMQLGYWKQ